MRKTNATNDKPDPACKPNDAPALETSLQRSRQLSQRASRVIWKGGKEATQHESLRGDGYPRYLDRAEGCHVWDVDGNRYLDYLMSWGSVLLGHAHPEVEQAVARQLAR